MAHERIVSRVQTGAAVLMLLAGIELIRYTYRSFDRALTFCFWEPERWNTHRLVDPGTVIEFAPRLGYFAIWGTIIMLSILAGLVGLYLLNRIRRGLIFDAVSARALGGLGLVVALAMVSDMIFHAFDPWLITRYNAEPLAVRWGYDPSDIKTLIMATILCLFGWVMHRSIEIDQQNREFV